MQAAEQRGMAIHCTGSQGTLGIVTEAEIKLIDVKKHKKLVTLFFDNWDSLPETVNEMLKYDPESMEVFDDSGLTAAMWDVPFNQRVKVTNLENGKSVIVRVNDRGPHRRFVREGRLIDLSKQAFSNIASLKRGLIDIELELL